MPLASRFTEGRWAALRIVADEVAVKRECTLCIDAVAARTGASRRLAQTAIRLAEGDGLLTVEVRRHHDGKNDTKVIRIISRAWLAWMKRGGIAVKEPDQHVDSVRSGDPVATAHAKEGRAMHVIDGGLTPKTVLLAESIKPPPEQRRFLQR